MSLKEGIHHEAGAHVVNVLAIKALIFEAECSSRAESAHGGCLGGNAGQLGINIESERTETLNVNAAPCSQIIVQVFNKCLPDDDHLIRVIRVCRYAKDLTYDLGSRGLLEVEVLSVE
jgi:hypothetical protein